MESKMPRTEGVPSKMKFISLFSGGLDSVCFTVHHSKSNDIQALIFDFGQKASREIPIAVDLAMSLGMNYQVIDIGFMVNLWARNQLTNSKVKVEDEYDPSVIVPLRNGIFLMIALSYAHSVEARGILLGAQLSSTKKFRHGNHDEYKYPDCSPEFVQQMTLAGISGTFRCAEPVRIYTPSAEGLDKSDLVKEGYEILGKDIFRTWTCRKNGDKQCGICEACQGRRDAFTKAGIMDETIYGH